MEGMKAYQHALDCSALQGSCREATEGFDAYGTNVRGGVMCCKGNSGCFRGCETPQALRASSPARRSSLLASGFRFQLQPGFDSCRSIYENE